MECWDSGAPGCQWVVVCSVGVGFGDLLAPVCLGRVGEPLRHVSVGWEEAEFQTVPAVTARVRGQAWEVQNRRQVVGWTGRPCLVVGWTGRQHSVVGWEGSG